MSCAGLRALAQPVLHCRAQGVGKICCCSSTKMVAESVQFRNFFQNCSENSNFFLRFLGFSFLYDTCVVGRVQNASTPSRGAFHHSFRRYCISVAKQQCCGRTPDIEVSRSSCGGGGNGGCSVGWHAAVTSSSEGNEQNALVLALVPVYFDDNVRCSSCTTILSPRMLSYPTHALKTTVYHWLMVNGDF